jgi:hypothetical protein
MMAGIKHNDAHNDIAIDRLRKIETFLLFI